ncbi:hypothetical protein GLOIN_2v1770278 [Rhizophagus irregularis DAOM 181602=DAOM 197198]|uniref:Protein kinase domain-containing protein n=2 Tax=Rhizophagus irregularis TaxID=588596 RepID=A0A2P4QCN4_RHIID|nr:hypothetical protein GLOIN_2v1770278 [Rhizophagus irregularis DAOM 181602=DAOM 197198]POG75401.1 hypothetical protein GLOIN_2v1770278 [Rhizophagus irregularis DAOM 181602=DAOM 197198]|eukprot:XP_025182267.1 hypothetical protein GLOIN_2v1770278 [Rhizophagus irregularis DAOM 181602=DAOM 197198]
MNNYTLVLEYADSELQLANTVLCLLCLHELDIIHRDLLVYQKYIKLEDFGLSRKISEASSNISKLMSSGRQPFKNIEYDKFNLAIHGGKREEIINETPTIEYKCWRYEPNERPSVRKLVSILKSIILKKNSTLVDDIYRKIMNGVKKDEVEALNGIRSAEQEYSDAQIILTEKDIGKAIYWYQKAADEGNKIVQYNLSYTQNKLGTLYKNGIGTDKDLEKTAHWYKEALDNGYKEAKENLDNIESRSHYS